MAIILVVDDEPSILKLVAAALEPHGHTIIEVDNGKDAIDVAHSDKPDLIILDIMMPGMDGNEVRTVLLADPKTKEIPIIHLSAVGDFNQQLEALDSDATIDYLTKPFEPADLRQRVADFLDPDKRKEIMKQRAQKAGKTRQIVDIMNRPTRPS
jgi:DNA-binding response OmpR family regulator